VQEARRLLDPPRRPRPVEVLLDRYDGLGVGVELVQVLADAVPRAALVRPASEAFVDDRCVRAQSRRSWRDPEHISIKLMNSAEFVGRQQVCSRVGHTVVGQLARDFPLTNARVRTVLPHPPAV